MFVDAGVGRWEEMLLENWDADIESGPDCIADYSERYTDIIHNIMTYGRASDVPLRPEIRRKLRDGYRIPPVDPWGNRYRFWPSSVPDSFPCDIPKLTIVDYYYDSPAIPSANQIGPKGTIIFVFSLGPDGKTNQPLQHGGNIQPNGDDIARW